MSRPKGIFKIKITKAQFKKIYYANTYAQAAKILGVCENAINRHARRLGFRKKVKRGTAFYEVKGRYHPSVIVGGLPT